jgi:hypothetical protein
MHLLSLSSTRHQLLYSDLDQDSNATISEHFILGYQHTEAVSYKPQRNALLKFVTYRENQECLTVVFDLKIKG